jgi:tRNA threonylcarbamoyladenosine modification (KEOPS) complex Cgi121 subunit
MNVAWHVLRGVALPARDAALLAADAAKPFGSEVQLVRPGVARGEAHVRSAALHAARAFHEQRARSDSLALEFLLFLSGERQIRRALDVAGLGAPPCDALAVALQGDAEHALRAVAQSLGCAAEAVRWPADRAAEDAALERAALLDLER